MKLQFTKMHGAGNDFVVIDATRRPFRPGREWLARLADRHFGVGCDQILVVEPPGEATVDFDYRIYNGDGSESGQCLNGARAFARYVRDHGLSSRNPLRVRTISTRMELQTLDSGEVRVNAGVPRLEPAAIPFAAGARAARYRLDLDGKAVEFAALSMGNPHAVLAVPDVETAAVAVIGAQLQRHPAFPQQANVGFLQIDSPERARLRVYERGAGETLACGSGACAAAVAGRLWGRLGPRVAMHMRGGVLTIEWAGEGEPVFIAGPVETVFRGELEWPS
jgi:diaminopimelate epimerase